MSTPSSMLTAGCASQGAGSHAKQEVGFDLSTCGVVLDIELSLDEDSSQGKLLPRSLSRGGARMLIGKLQKTAESARF